MMQKKYIASLGITLSLVSSAALSASLGIGDPLTIHPGITTYDSNNNLSSVTVSWFAMDFNNDGKIHQVEKTPLSQGTTGIIIGAITPPGASHAGMATPSDSNMIDQPWSFFANTGSHYNTEPIVGGTSGLTMGGWAVTWNGIPNIPMGSGAWTPSNCADANMSCVPYVNGMAQFSWDGVYGNPYTLDYTATVPLNHPSGFGGVKYALHLEGTVAPVPIPAAIWLLGSGLLGLIGVARRRITA